jgi:hypothetical protein
MLDLQFSSTLTLENLSAHAIAIDHARQDCLSKCTAFSPFFADQIGVGVKVTDEHKCRL